MQKWKCIDCGKSSGLVDQAPDEWEKVNQFAFRCPECAQPTKSDIEKRLSRIEQKLDEINKKLKEDKHESCI